jgi:hypothetical protein
LRRSPAYFLKQASFPFCTRDFYRQVGSTARDRSLAKDTRHWFLSFSIAVDSFYSQGERPMTKTIKTPQYYAAIAALLMVASPTHAGPCARTIASVQAQVDATIEKRADSGGWKPESLDALRGYQPTPRSLAAAEGSDEQRFKYALDSLDRARAADRDGDSAACHRELANARAALHQ